MSKNNHRNPQIGKTKRSTDAIIDEAIARQNSWMSRRREFAKKFLKRLNIFARREKPKVQPVVKPEPVQKARVYDSSSEKKSELGAYWFPILCALLVILIAIWVLFFRSVTMSERVMVVPAVPEPIVQVVDENAAPEFDIVRIERDGYIIVAGRWIPHQNISIVVNNKIVATERTDSHGEFVYAPSRAFNPGNYTISLVGADKDAESENRVFVYVSPKGFENSISLLMTKDGSTILQAPKLVDGDLSISKIDYLDNGRIIVTGDALPRMRVTLTLDGNDLGSARVSDHKHFGLGGNAGKLEPGRDYSLGVRLHDGNGKTVSEVIHRFTMPTATGGDNTFYTVRRGDCLWIVARNFLGKGVMFSLIVEKNNISNPDLIFPAQVLRIPLN